MIVSVQDILNASILIVDDQDANVQLLARMLGEAGYARVASTKNPLEVCSLHRRNSYDLILLDLQMPRMNGFEVLEGLTNEAAVSVLVLSADPAHMARALAAGAKGFLSKPFVLAEVLSRVNLMLSCGLEDPEPLLTTEAFPWLRATV